jgi:hypothetical protein
VLRLGGAFSFTRRGSRVRGRNEKESGDKSPHSKNAAPISLPFRFISSWVPGFLISQPVDISAIKSFTEWPVGSPAEAGRFGCGQRKVRRALRN